MLFVDPDTTRYEPEAGRRVEFSVIVPVWKPEPEHLRICIASVLNQTYDGWELLLVINGPQPDEVDDVLAEVAGHPNVQMVRLPENQGIAAATQVGLEAATSEFVALLDHDDEYSIHALGAFAAELLRFDDVDLAYSDEDKLANETGQRTMPFYKPAFSMERLRCQMYLGHLLVFRRALALKVGGFRSEFDGAQDHDLALRIAEEARCVVHLPRILYHWRESPSSTALDMGAKSWAWEAGAAAVASHLTRTGFPAEAEPHPGAAGVTRLNPRLADHPSVSIVIPTGGSRRLLNGIDVVLIERALSTIVGHSTYPNYEVVVVVDRQSDIELTGLIAKTVDQAAGWSGRNGSRPALEIVVDDQPFNFARACNLGAIRSSGHILAFLNDDIEIVQGDWLERLVMYAGQPSIGAVGAKLLYGDGRIQHAGVWSREGGPAHRYVGYGGDHQGNFSALHLAQNCLAVTGACLVVERDKFDHVGGFSTIFPLAYNDVDLCLKLSRHGLRTVVDCTVEVVHHESSSRDPQVRQWEVDHLNRRWRLALHADPFDNPCNLASGVEEYPPTPVELVERKSDMGELALVGRGWRSRPTVLLETASD